MNRKSVGKKAEPTGEELEFIYSKFQEKLSDQEALEEMQDQPFLRRSLGFIKRRRKEFNAAKYVLKKQLERENDPVITGQRKKHNHDLTKMAKSLLANDLDLIIHIEAPKEDGDFYGWLYDSEKYVISSKEELTKLLWRNVDDANEKFRPLDMFSSFEEHFDHESTSGKGFKVLARTEPFELIQLLKLLAQRGTFRSRCEICKGWY